MNFKEAKQIIAGLPKKIIWSKQAFNLPPGWIKESLRSFWNELTGDRKHKVSACMKKIEGVPGIDNPGAFCNSLAQELGGE